MIKTIVVVGLVVLVFVIAITIAVLRQYIMVLKQQKGRAVADYIEASTMLVDLACPKYPEDICHHQKLLREHRMKGCTIINGN